MFTRQQLIDKYLQFFKSKKHAVIHPASLVPQNDPTVLFTTAGMQPLVPYLSGQKHPLGKRLVDVQKCIRTGDIDTIGDPTHHTFFEMLGNWSLGDYWKSDSIKYSFEFLTQELKIPVERLAVTCFEGDKNAPKDTESAKIWQSLGIKKERIAFLPKEDNWWGPAGQTGPCGPDTEIFFWSPSAPAPKNFDSADKRWVEIWNNVFMEYEKHSDGSYKKAKQQNVDTGMGVERTVAALNGLDDNYATDSFSTIIKQIESYSEKKYSNEKNKEAMRIVADHTRAAVFILGDESQVAPSNVGQGYVLRRLIRRAIRYANLIGIKEEFLPKLANTVITQYSKTYPELEKNKSFVLTELQKEELKFIQTLEAGLKEFEKLIHSSKNKTLSGKEVFLLYQSFGFPFELTEELAHEKHITLNKKDYEQEYNKHQELSRSTSSGMFKSGLADNSEQTTKLHTATHMLNEALRHILGSEVKQRGSNITSERLRFDFNFPRKVTPEEIAKVEALVNKKISESLEVTRSEMKLEEAFESGAQGEFGHKYPPKVSVYTIGPMKGWFSREICTGPHVKNTHEIGHFKIIKEEGVSAGVRRIKAIIK